ncbi:hypothetical protein [Nocardia wallacei]|uniref:hypothetical protein n=1 Tax=Nocardia wallacei TaxID=480035 RepID=UPI0024581AFA|nr:hypothetical protein [Nocardia wallacei]
MRTSIRLRFLGTGDSGKTNCPTLYATDRGTYVVQGWKTGAPGTVEIPHMLLGYLENQTFIDTALVDSGRGTFTLTGRPIDDAPTLEQMTFQPNETAIEVPMKGRSYFGGVPAE